jgi:biotin carboxylase
MQFPLIVKPVDLTGGKGISVAAGPESLGHALSKAFAVTRAGRVVVEEFVEGSRHGFTCLIESGRAIFHFMDDEHYFLNPYLVSAASTPSSAPVSAALALSGEVERIARLLGLVDGIVHVQYIYSGGKPVIIEICRRPPGDLYVELVRLATGVDYPAQIVRAACGLSYDGLTQAEPAGFFLRHCVMSRRSGRIEGLEIATKAQSRLVDQMMWWVPGDVIADVLTHKLGIMFFRFNDQAEMRDMAGRMQDLVRPILAA